MVKERGKKKKREGWSGRRRWDESGSATAGVPIMGEGMDGDFY
jgi:hypothetical protein